MVELKRVHDELFRRTADECFETFDDLYGHCSMNREFPRLLTTASATGTSRHCQPHSIDSRR